MDAHLAERRGAPAAVLRRRVRRRLRATRHLLETGQNDGIGGLDEEAPEVALRTAVAYLRDCHGYCLVHGCTLDDGSPDLEAELAELVDDAED